MKKYGLVLVILLSVFGLGKQVFAATLTLSPANGSFKAGETFKVDIKLDTTREPIDGVDIFYLRYNPAIVEVLDANKSTAGIQVTPGSLFPLTLANTVDPTSGKITFSQVTSGGTSYTGAGVLATIDFRALSAGDVDLAFDFVRGNTADTNVAGKGQDLLTRATGAKFAISGATVSPTTNSTSEQTPNPDQVAVGSENQGSNPGGMNSGEPSPQSVQPISSAGLDPMMLTGYGLAGLVVLGLLFWLYIRAKSPAVLIPQENPVPEAPPADPNKQDQQN